MFRNYFSATYRHALKNKVHFLFKVGGLSLSLFSLLVIAIYLSFQWSFDKFQYDRENVYRVNSLRDENGVLAPYATVPVALGPALKAEFPDVAAFCRIGLGGNHLIKFKDNLVRIDAMVDADSSIFDVLTFKFVAGDKNALDRPGTIVLTESVAHSIFGDEDPVNKIITFTDHGNRSFEVSAVIEDLPVNSHLYIHGIMNFVALQEQYIERSNPWEISWDASIILYVRLTGGTDAAAFEDKAIPFIRRNLRRTEDSSEKRFEIFLQPIVDIYLGPSMKMDFMVAKRGSTLYVYVFSLLGLFLIIISSINYINLSIADYEGRTKEMALRKILGARKKQIGMQVFVDALLICLLSLIISIGVLYILFPGIASLLNADMRFEMLWNSDVMTLVALIFVLLVMLSSAYPAFHLAIQAPLKDLKHGHGLGHGGRVLLLAQFSISIICICATSIVGRQISFLTMKDLGYDRDNLLYLSMPGQYPWDRAATIKDQISRLPGVESASYTYYPVVSVYFKDWYDVEIDRQMTKVLLNEMFVDYDFLKTMNIKLKEGRDFDVRNPKDGTAAFIVNETAAREFKWNEPVGMRIKLHATDAGTWEGTVVGVVKDFNTQSLHEKIEPVVLRLPFDSWPGCCLNIRINGSVSKSLDPILSTYQKAMPGFIAEYRIVNDSYENQYRNESKAFAALKLGTVIIVLISVLGIFSISVYISVKRMREFGIRKVLGASTSQIAGLHAAYFLRIGLLANLIALPISYLLMKEWVSLFAYKTPLSGIIFFGVAAILFLIILVSSSYSAWKAGTTNPVDVIKVQ